MEKIIEFLKALPLPWRIVAFIGVALIASALVFSSCVMFQSSASTDARGELDVSPSALQRDTVVCYRGELDVSPSALQRDTVVCYPVSVGRMR